MPRFCCFIPLMLTVLLAAGCHAGRPSGHAMFAPVPGNILPSPNAFDYYAKAGNDLHEVNKITAALDPTSSPVVQEHLVRENAPVLTLLRAGFAFPYMNPAQRSALESWPYYAKDRELARLLRLEGKVKASRGDWSGAVSSNLDAVRMGQDIPRGGTLIGMLVGVACQAIGRRDIWDDMAHLSAPEAKAAAHRLKDVAARHVSYADVMQQEKYFGQSVLQSVFQSHNWRDRLVFRSPTTSYDNYTGYMDKVISNGRGPYAAKLPLPSEPSDSIASIVLPTLGNSQLRDADTQTQDALLLVTLALRAYQLEHGGPPETLAALVPVYLSKVPDDPFALAGPLRYRRTGKTCLLYSVRPDGKDDGRKAIFDSTVAHLITPSRNDRRHFVNVDSVGDIVAGVNII